MDSKGKALLGLVVACGAGLSVMGATVVTEHKPTLLQRLLSDDTHEIREAENEIITSRKRLIEDLKSMVGKSENRTRRQLSVRAAILILGEMRAVECVELLVQNIEFPYVREPDSEPRPGPPVGAGTIGVGLKAVERSYPAVQSLVKIGEPCIDEIMKKLSVTNNVAELNACLAVLVGLRDRPYVIGMLERAVEEETDPKHVERLQRAINELMREDDENRKAGGSG